MPAAVGPITAVRLPARATKLTPWSAAFWPYFTVRSETTISPRMVERMVPIDLLTGALMTSATRA